MIVRVLLFFTLLFGFLNSHAKTVNIAMVFDGPMKREIAPIKLIQQEILAITQNEFDVQFPTNLTVTGQWQLAGIREAITKLEQDKSVDIILTYGVLSSHLASQFESLSKPVIATIIADRVLQELPYTEGVSGKNNFTYITDNHKIEDDIKQLFRLTPFKHLVVPADHNILEALPSLTKTVTGVQKQLSFKLTFIPVFNNLGNTLAEIPATADALYIPPLMRFNKQTIKTFSDQITLRGLPSFSLLGLPDLELGLMATLRGRKIDALRFARRIALNVQSILLGSNASQLKVDLDQPAKLAINMKTVKALGLSLKWQILERAELINNKPFTDKNLITLKQAIRHAVAANLGLQVDRQNISLAEDQVDSARSALLPQISVGVTANLINQDKAGLLQPERTADAEVKLSQLIYSERNWSNFDVARLLKQAEDAAFQTRILDVMQNTATAYVRVLLTRATELVRQSDLKVSETNLELAQSRLKIGFSDRSDVLRWKSEIAIDRSNLYVARSEREQTETALKRLLHLPLPEEIAVTDKGIAEQIAMLNNPKFMRFFDNTTNFNTFMAFEVERAFDNAPELKQIDHLIASSKRQLSAGQRAYYVPDVSLNAHFGQNISQGGVGANNQNFHEDNWSVGVQATLPLFTSGARPAEISRASHSILQNKYQRSNIVERIEARVRAALQKTKGSFPAIRLTKAAAEAANNNFEMVSDAYAKGVVSITSLIDAQNAVLSSRLSAVQALYLFMIDWVEVQRAVASFDLLIEEQSIENWYQQMDLFFNHRS